MDHPQVALSNNLHAEKSFLQQLTTGCSSVLPLAPARLARTRTHSFFLHPLPPLPFLVLAPGMAEATHSLGFFPATTLMT